MSVNDMLTESTHLYQRAAKAGTGDQTEGTDGEDLLQLVTKNIYSGGMYKHPDYETSGTFEGSVGGVESRCSSRSFRSFIALYCRGL
jgi:hypothetical protein